MCIRDSIYAVSPSQATLVSMTTRVEYDYTGKAVCSNTYCLQFGQVLSDDVWTWGLTGSTGGVSGLAGARKVTMVVDSGGMYALPVAKLRLAHR
eukprot:1755509-Rhodomonas_salina.3